MERVLLAEARVARRSSYFASGRERVGTILIRAAAVLLLALVVATVAPNASGSREAAVQVVYRIDHVTDGDTVVLRNGQRVRLVQIDTPEVFFGTECYGPQASATAKRLLPPGTRVRLFPEPATDRVDDFGRLLRYVIRADGVNVNLRLVALGAAAPYFYEGRRGPVCRRGSRRWRRAPASRSAGSGGRVRGRVYDPYRGIETRR